MNAIRSRLAYRHVARLAPGPARLILGIAVWLSSHRIETPTILAASLRETYSAGLRQLEALDNFIRRTFELGLAVFCSSAQALEIFSESLVSISRGQVFCVHL